LKPLVTVLALLTSIASLVVIAGGGLALLAIEVSGERGVGALLALCSGLAFAAVVALVLAPDGFFGEGIRRAGAIAAGIVGAIPVAALAYVAIRFAGIPIGSRMPLLDWAVLAVGIVFGLGALAILALGHRRSQEGSTPSEAAVPIVHMQQIRHAQQQLRSAFEADDRAPVISDQDDDIRVRRV
jgi:hypothetical protein